MNIGRKLLASILLLAALALHAGSYDKSNALLRAQIHDDERSASLAKGANQDLHLLIRTKNPEILDRFGIDARMRAGEFITAMVPLHLLDSLLACPEVISVSTGALCTPQLDQSAADAHVDRVHRGDLGQSYTGNGVIIGIYDSGIDWTHPDFITDSGESRILFLWDQLDNSGSPPFEFGSGSEFTGEQISRVLRRESSESIAGIDDTGHGTHVAGVAAGNGSLYRGMAPDARLIVVKGSDQGFSSVNVLEGLNYMISKAEEYGGPKQPVVVNFSLGTHYGPHDGTSDFEQAVDAILLQTDRELVVAAGNEREQAIHAQVTSDALQQSQTISLPVQIGTTQTGSLDYVKIDGWYSGLANIAISIETPSGISIGPVYANFPVEEIQTSDGTIYLDNASLGTNARNGDNEVLIRLSDSQSNGSFSDNLKAGEWTIRLSGDPARFDAWIYESSVHSEFTAYNDLGTMIVEPGNSSLCLTVSSYVTRDEWPSSLANPWSPRQIEIGSLSHFSNRGPARPNTNNPSASRKPEVSAPGEYILSAISSFVPLQNYPTGFYLTDDSLYMAREGTSIAAPHVTGIIALLLEANPELTLSQVRGALIASARKDSYTGDCWNADWGYGKIDAFAALSRVDVDQPETASLPTSFKIGQNFPNPFNGETSFEISIPGRVLSAASGLELTIVDCLGRIVARSEIHNPQNNAVIFSWDGRDQNGVEVHSGIYVAHVRMGRETASVKMILLK